MGMEKGKAMVVLLLTGLSSWLGSLAVPVLALVGSSIVDYLTGCAAAKYRGEALSSGRGIHGIVKKVCLLLLVVVGGLVDWMLLFAGSSVGVDLPFQFVVSTLVALWLVCNELLSILENIADIGVELPAFLMPLVRRIKLETQEKVPDKEEESHV